MRKLRRADQLIAEGKTGEEVAADLGVGADVVQLAPHLRRHGYRPRQGTQTLREQNARIKRLLAEAQLDRYALRKVEDSEPSCQAGAVDMLKDTLGMSERLACKGVGLGRPPTGRCQWQRRQLIRT